MRVSPMILLATVLGAALPAWAQEPVAGVADPDALFHSPDPQLERNKQAAYHIIKDLIEAGHWNEAGRYLTERYIQHNPLAKSGLEGVVYYFTQVRKDKPKPIPAHMKSKIVAVLADGDKVTVAYAREMPDPRSPGKTYTTTWFDMWRFVNGKADEHWDPAMLPTH